MLKIQRVRTKSMLFLIILSTVTTISSESFATIYAETHFNTGLEGWTAVGDGSISWQATGGNPGGYLQAVDPALGINTDAAAPMPFLGDWSSLDGIGWLSVDLTIISGGNVTDGEMFQISGPGGAAYVLWPITAGPPHGQWDTFSVRMDKSAWTMTSGTWEGLLLNVQSLLIDLEHINGVETTGLDNVVLTPEPCTLFLFAFGGLAAMRRHRV